MENVIARSEATRRSDPQGRPEEALRRGDLINNKILILETPTHPEALGVTDIPTPYVPIGDFGISVRRAFLRFFYIIAADS